ncbi:MAG: NAD(P)-dependent oxidoreductase [Planctomycetota bacterium]
MSGLRVTVAVFDESSGWVVPQSFVDRLAVGLPAESVTIRRVSSRAELREALGTTDVLVGFPMNEAPGADAAPSLRWIVLTETAGEPVASLGEAIARGVRVTTANAFRAPQVAEHALALLLALVRRLHRAMARQSEHHWADDELARQVGTLSGRTVGVLASGAVGQAIAQRVHAFGARVLATRRDADNPYMFVEEVYTTDRLDELLVQVDALVVALPRLASTRGLIGERELAKLRPHSLLVDVSRGGVVQEAPLLEAVRRGRFDGVALDVFETEPLPPSSPLWTMPSVIVTPHIAAASPRYWEQAAEAIAANLHRFVAEEPLADLVPIEWTRDVARA